MEGSAVTDATLRVFERAVRRDEERRPGPASLPQAHAGRRRARDRAGRARSPVQGRLQRAAGDRVQGHAGDPQPLHALRRSAARARQLPGHRNARRTPDRSGRDVRARARHRARPLRVPAALRRAPGAPAPPGRRRLPRAHLRTVRNALGRLLLPPHHGTQRKRALRAALDAAAAEAAQRVQPSGVSRLSSCDRSRSSARASGTRSRSRRTR